MEANRRQNRGDATNFKVKDPMGILITVVTLIGSIIGFLFCIFVPGALLFGVVLFPTIFLAFFRLKAISGGVEFILETHELSFPGGGISANEFSDYFSKDWLLQFFKRYTVKIDDIMQMYNDVNYRF